MTLRDRPVLYRFCAEELAAALHNALFQRFIEALTRGSRPIEMHSDDPKRFINDMLAWVHQALASERELLENLFGDDNSGDLGGVGVSEAGEIPSSAHPVTRDEKMQNESVVSVEELLDSVFQSVCRPLKVRIEQVLIASPTVLLCFELSQLLAFYLETIGGLAGQRCQIVAVLRGCKEMASRTFQELLRARCDKLLRNAPVVPQDLSAPQQVMEIVVQLGEVAAAHGSSTTASPDESSLSDVVSSTVDLLVEVCEQTSEALSPDAPTRVDEAASMDPAVQRSFLVNCMDAIHGCLADHPAARGRAAGLANAIEGHLEALATAGVANVLARCGMAEIVSRVAEYDAAEPGSRKMASDPALGLSRVSSAMRAFFLDVSRPEALPEFREVLAPRLRTGAAGRVAAALAEAYEEVYSAVGRAENGYGPEGGVERIRHTPAQVRTILCVS
ncbi:unnamed protein product [Ostreobium quekettii]|uniref:Conserved Oligomeric Golgi complex subunit 6 C-terminal domain-containing protein n=1 Tax=Ostreobium quekettii TaxID=121088 RepID=A0A8S1IUT7_9CHLO|nr:unnamed protein product [Ostreobium quekettii]